MTTEFCAKRLIVAIVFIEISSPFWEIEVFYLLLNQSYFL